MAAVAQVRLRAADGRRRARHAHQLGLDAYGVSFHVGSQMTEVMPGIARWPMPSASSCTLAKQGIELKMVNMGGGFPTKYLKDVPAAEAYGQAIFAALRKHFGNHIPETIIEPGRGMVGNAGVIKSEVVLISKKSDNDNVRWVFLDIGKFGGLAETMDEAIRYPIRTERDGDEMEPCVLAGPTCDSADVLYEKKPYPLPIVADDRRRGADRRHRRLHDDLLGGRLQRLRAAPILRDLTGSHSASFGRRPVTTPPGRRWSRSVFRRTLVATPGSLVEQISAREGSRKWKSSVRNRETPCAGLRHRRRNRCRRRARAKRCSTVPWGRSGASKSSEKLRRGRRPSEGLAFVARDASGARGRHGAAVGRRAGRGRSGGAAARPARRRSVAEERRHRLGADASCDRRSGAARSPRRSCWSAMRPTMRASASRPTRPVRLPCRARTSGTACWRWSWSTARSTARSGTLKAAGRKLKARRDDGGLSSRADVKRKRPRSKRRRFSLADRAALSRSTG